MSQETAPPAESRPKLWRYYRERGLTREEVGHAFGRTAEWVRLVCLPFSSDKRRVPSPDDVERGYQWSGGEIRPQDWYPPHLSEPTEIKAPSEVGAS